MRSTFATRCRDKTDTHFVPLVISDGVFFEFSINQSRFHHATSAQANPSIGADVSWLFLRKLDSAQFLVS